MPRWFSVLLILLLAGCSGAPVAVKTPVPLPAAATAASTHSAVPPTQTPLSAPTATVAPAPTQTATLPVIDFYEPAGCLKPPDEAGDVVEVNGWQLNERTLAMLTHAQALYGGPLELTGAAVTQGSYHDNGSASFGTHMGGGAVDLSIFTPGTWQVDFTNLNRLLLALRAAGFAAWVRSIDEVFPGSGWHIHAVALGDPQLSPAAQDQISGVYGYLRGYNGLPQADGVPVPDVDGAPLLCSWMLEMGYSDMRADVSSLPSAPAPPADWQQRLYAAAQDFQAHTAQEAGVLAAQLYTTPDWLTWVLPGALWEAAGLLPRGISPADNPRNFAKLRSDAETFWGWFSPDDYVHVLPDAPPRAVDLNANVLLPGDLLYLRAVDGKDGLPLVVVALDAENNPLILLAEASTDGWRVQIRLLQDVVAGEWINFDLLRYRGLALPPDSRFAYAVQPGDTLPSIASRFGVSLETLLRGNHLPDPARLVVGESIWIQK